MDFFADQARARRKTVLLVLMFIAAVVGIVLWIDIAVGYSYLLSYGKPLFPIAGALAAVPHSVYAITTLLALLVIISGSFTRMQALSEGGAAVAEMVGARCLKWNTEDPQERRLLNIIEEMSLAAGISLPRVYTMDNEAAINAFAAGYSPDEAAVVVTRGALEGFNRDELQGVVAHEFSHILNGDMRLNIRLLGVIAGLVMVASIGASLNRDLHWDELLRPTPRSTTTIPTALLSVIGLVLWTIGSIGLFFGRLIRAVISREREFLADASAVQFTRNPEGIASALFKISERGSEIFEPHAEELSHMCISMPAGDRLEFAWFRTHPPLVERIERLMGPGAMRLLELATRAEAPRITQPESRPAARASSASGSGFVTTTPQAVLASVGNPSSAHVDHARQVLDAIPAEIRAAMQSAEGAQAVLFSLLLGEGEARKRQLLLIGEGSTPEVAAQSARFADALKPLGEHMCLPLLELAMPALKALPQSERDELLERIQAVIEAAGEVTLGEFVLRTVCRRHLRKEAKGPPPVKHRGIDGVAAQAGVVLSLLAHSGGGGTAAFEKGMAALGISEGALREPSELNVTAVEGALYELRFLAPLNKLQFIGACLAVVMADDTLTVSEGELLRAVCAALEMPLPPLLESIEAVA